MKLKVMLIDEDSSRTEMLTTSLIEAGFEVSGRASCEDDILAGIHICNPDVLVIDMDSPDDYIFNQLAEINKECPKPIVFFADKGETNVIKKAVKTGVSAFIVDGLAARRMKPVIELAVIRFKEMQSLYKELTETKTNLEERKVIERAKGILMSKKKVSEDEAYSLLRKLAMEQNKKLIDVARSMIELSELFS